MTIFNDFNNTAIDYPSKTLPQLFIEQVTKTPDQIALICDGTAITYAELNQTTNQLAHYLKSMIDTSNPFIAIYMDRSPDLIIGILSILKAGGAYVPLDIHIPKERMKYIFENSQVSLVLTDSACLPDLPNTSVPIHCIDKINTEIQSANHLNCDNSQLTDLAYIIFTSGSTGLPKGVMTEHQAICNTLLHFKHAMAIQPKDVLLSITTITFDPSILDIFLPLISGAALFLAPYLFNREPSLIAECIEKHKVTLLQATPATWKALLNNGWKGNQELVIMSMGEPLMPDLAQLLISRCKCVWNLYGPTELAIYSTAEQITLNTDLRFISIGKPIANVQLYILDELMQQVPLGTAGELYIGGKGIGRGYLNAALTKERYVANPFSKKPNDLLYKTGDLCTWLPDGRVKIFGRLDFQVKIRGFRVELGEIEMVLKKYEAINDAVVLAIEDETNEKKLVAYYLTNHKPVDEIILQAHLKNYLPEYMVPFTFMHLEQFPLNSNGKIDRKALPKPTFKRETPYQAPQNQLEKSLNAIWEELLHTNNISMHDSIFALGGHSLLIMAILAKVSQFYSVNIAFHEFYQTPTIAGLAALIVRNAVIPGKNQHLPQSSSSVNLLSEIQLNLWMINKFYPASSSLNIVETRRIAGKLTIEGIDFAIDCILKKYPLLTCQISRWLPIQTYQADIKLHSEQYFLQTATLEEQEQLLKNSLAELKKNTTWKKGHALIKVRLFDLPNNHSELHLCVSHLVADNKTIEVLFSELSYFYNQFGFESPVVISSQSYHDCMVLRDLRLKKTMIRDGLFWKNYLSNVTALTLPKNDFINVRSCEKSNCHSLIELSDQWLHGWQSKSNQYQVSLVDTLNAIIATALIEYSEYQGEQFVITLVKSGRETEAENTIVGNFIQANLIKVPVTKKMPVMELAQRIHQTVIDSQPYQYTYSCVKHQLPTKKTALHKIIGSLFKAYTYVMMKFMKIRYKQQPNKDFLFSYCDMIASMLFIKKTQTNQQLIQVNVNLLNNFFIADTSETLFNYPIINAEEFQDQGISSPNTLTFTFYRDKIDKKRYLLLQVNLIEVKRNRLIQKIKKLIINDLQMHQIS